MTLRVSGKNLDIGEFLRQHVLEKVELMVAHYFNGSVGGSRRDHPRGFWLSRRVRAAPQFGRQPACGG